MIRNALLFFSAVALAAAPDSRIDGIIKQLDQVHNFSGISISPDGERIAWVQPARQNESASEIYILDWKKENAKPTLVTEAEGKGSSHQGGIAWAPDSGEIAFLSDAGATQSQVFVAAASTAKARKLTNLSGYVSAIRWSPDGKQIGFLYAAGGGGGGPLEAVPAQVGAIGSEIHNQRVTVMNAADGSGLRELSPAELNVYEYDWSPDGRRFAAIAAPGPADNNWWIAQLYTLDASSGQMKSVYRPPSERQIAVPRWSPDGKQIGFLGGIMSDEGFDGGDIYVVSANGGEARNMTPDIKASPNGLVWRNNHEILFTESLDGGGAIAALDTPSGTVEVLWKGSENLHQDGNFPNLAVAKDGRTSAAIRSTWEQAPEVFAGPIGDWNQITHENSAQQPHWGKTESIAWENDGFHIQGWLLYPVNFDQRKRYPMIVSIHGGPAGQRSASWPSSHYDMSVMAALGYFVLFPNPRGSYGGGEQFTRANVKDLGGGDLRDVLAGVDAVLKMAPVDKDRIGVTGWSYGGFMTMWTVTQTNRFRAAVAGAGIADWLSYYGENTIDQWMIPYFGATVYDDPAVYAKSSPITFIRNVKTPTLVVVGERDGECPAPQSFEFWHALKAQNVPTELVVYAGEGHSFHEQKDRVDVLRRAAMWFDKYLGVTASAAAN